MTVNFTFIFSLVALISVHQTFHFVKGQRKISFLVYLISRASVEVCLTIKGLYNVHQVPRFVKAIQKIIFSPVIGGG